MRKPYTHSLEYLIKKAASSSIVSPRSAEMVRLHRSGKTLQEIGDLYGVTRERVRQIIKKMGVASKDGGGHTAMLKRRAQQASKRDERCLARHGCTYAQYRVLVMMGRGLTRETGPTGAFIRQKVNARLRGIEWKLLMWEWWTVWQESGKWSERGRGQGYCMARKGDEGAYELGNVFITSAIDNSSSQYGERALPLGVSKKGNKFLSKRMVDGTMHYLGSHASPEAAHAAYIEFAPVPQVMTPV